VRYKQSGTESSVPARCCKVRQWLAYAWC